MAADRTAHLVLTGLLASIGHFASDPASAQAQTVTVSTVSELQNAVNAANAAGGNTTILVADGTYTLNDTLYINAPNVTLAGRSGDRTKVTIQGDAMSSTAVVGSVIRAAGKNFKLHDLTLQRSRFHLIQIVGEADADGPEIRNCVLRDAYEQMLKVSVDLADLSVTADNGLVENCIFEYTAGIGPQYYIGGIDAHGSKNWIVRDNVFRFIISPNTSVAEYAVHFWDGSANNVVERNLIVNCDRGIGFGLDGRGNTGGIIRNNMIYHAANAGQFADTGISLAESPNTRVYNNTVILEQNFPWAIDYRFASTGNVLLVNNLTNKPLQSRDGATATLASNVTTAADNWFVDTSAGDLHLATAVDVVVDKGQTVSGLTNDFDDDERPLGTGIDIGADEFSSAVGPLPPTALRAD